MQDQLHVIHVDDHTIIRPYCADDAPALYPRLIAEQSELFWIQSIANMRSIDDLLAEFRRVRQLLDEGKRFGGAVVVDGRIVGSCRIAHIDPNAARPTGDLGYWLFREARGHGV